MIRQGPQPRRSPILRRSAEICDLPVPARIRPFSPLPFAARHAILICIFVLWGKVCSLQKPIENILLS